MSCNDPVTRIHVEPAQEIHMATLGARPRAAQWLQAWGVSSGGTLLYIRLREEPDVPMRGDAVGALDLAGDRRRRFEAGAEPERSLAGSQNVQENDQQLRGASTCPSNPASHSALYGQHEVTPVE